jgi:ribosomal protein S10
MLLQLNISSKNQKSIKKFLTFIKRIKINMIIQYFQKKKKKKLISILKSPHVTKTAQEQFEYKTFSKKLIIFSFNVIPLIILFKKIKNKLFSDLQMELRLLTNKKVKTKKLLKKIVNPDTFIIKTKKIKNYLKLYDIYGETLLKQNKIV